MPSTQLPSGRHFSLKSWLATTAAHLLPTTKNSVPPVAVSQAAERAKPLLIKSQTLQTQLFLQIVIVVAMVFFTKTETITIYYTPQALNFQHGALHQK